MTEKTGYSTTTYRVRLYDKHRAWLERTCEIYNQVQKFYYDIVIEHPALWKLSGQPMMRQLELLTIGARGQTEELEHPFPYGKVPLYFRRAAINAAIGASRGYIREYLAYQLQQEKAVADAKPNQQETAEDKVTGHTGGNDRVQKWEPPVKAEKFQASPVFYAGMYRNLTADRIELKLWNGTKWVWTAYRYDKLDRPFPEACEIKSPALKLTKEAAWLHFPVITSVEDVRTVKERISQGEDICAVYFPYNDNLAVCSWMKCDGSIMGHYFIKGGRQRKEQLRRLLVQLKKKNSRTEEAERTGQIEKAEQIGKAGQDNSRIYKKIADLNQNYTHKASREILNYCEKNHIKVIVVPNYEKTISFRDKQYLQMNEFEWIGRGIIHNLKYKSYQMGIVTSTVRPYHIVDTCGVCGAPVKRYNEGHRPARQYLGGQLYICENGHRGNSAQNGADNVGKSFLKFYQDINR